MATSTQSSDRGSQAEVIDRTLGNPIFRSLYTSPFDTITREMALINTLRPLTETSPARIFIFYELFPQMNDQFLSLALQRDGFRHTLLASAALIRDVFQCRGPSELYLVQKTKSLQLLQHAISSDTVDEAVFAAVIMQIFSDLCLNDICAVQRHLQGLLLIYKRLQQQAVDSCGRQGSLSPLTRFIARLAVVVDFTHAALLGEFPLWPEMTPLDEMEDRKWLTKLAFLNNNMPRQTIEWALASFEIDNLWHRTYRFAKQSDLYRTSRDTFSEEKIQLEYHKLIQSFHLWKQRSVIIEQKEVERYARSTGKPSSHQFHRFLHHESLYLQNHYYAKILNQWRAARIYATTVAHPVPPSDTEATNRFQVAVDICKTHAALGMEGSFGPQWWCLFYAGFGFQGPRRNPVECDWIVDRCRGIALYFPILKPVIENMPAIWTLEKFYWNPWGALWWQL